MMTRRLAGSSILLLGLLAAAFWFAAEHPGPGPLGLVGAVAAFHAAVLGPSCGVYGFLPLALSLPALAAASYGTDSLLPSVLLVALATLAGAAARALGRLYLPMMTLLFLAPFALSYLVLEFGHLASVPAWRLVSPVAASFHVAGAAGSAWPPAACVIGLLVAPVAWIARRGLKGRAR